jgi:SAM-dependent methyltransferase
LNALTNISSNRELNVSGGLDPVDPPAVPAGTTTCGFQLSLLAELHCPYCASPLALAFTTVPSITSENDNCVEYGIVRCACSQYPVLEGIPILQHADGLDRVVEFIRKGECRQALLQAMNIFRVKWAHRTRWHQVHYHLNCRRVVSRPDLSFAQAVDLVRRPQIFSDYLLHRFANPSFLAAMAPLLLLDSLAHPSSPTGSAPKIETRSVAPKRVFDLACGAGHASFLIRRLFPGMALVSADQDFVSLYLAKRFLAPDATHVCFDTEVPNPFPNDFFDGVFCLDAFHYFHSKAAIVSELQRVVNSNGIWIFPHLHNLLQPNVTAGIPLSPDSYLESFSSVEPRLFAEQDILRALCTNQSLDWSVRNSADDLHFAPALTLVGGPQRHFGVQQAPLAAFCYPPCRLAINPIYRAVQKGEGALLTLNWPNMTLRMECDGVKAYLPETFLLRASDLRAISRREFNWQDPRTQELLRQFVVVPLPAHYS